MLQLLFWFCYACAVWRILGFTDSLFQELKLIQVLLASTSHTVLCVMAKHYKMWRERHPQHKPLQTFWNKKLLPTSWKHCRMQLQKIKTLNKCKLQWSLNVPLRKQMGFAQPAVEMSTFCRAVFSGCSNGHSSGAMICPGVEKHSLSLCCFPMGDSLVWERRHGVGRICFLLPSEYLKWRKMNNGERVTTTKSSELLKTKFELRKRVWKDFFQMKHDESLS